MDSDPLLQPEARVLSTLDNDGSRRWLKPLLSQGAYFRARKIVAYVLIGIYVAIPFIHVGGKPLVLLDLPARRFTIFGFTFLPTDTVLLALFMVGALLSFFLMTALVGRVWCGWACPHTVFMEFVIRPLERLFDHTLGRGGTPRRNGPRPNIGLRYLSFFVVAWLLANLLIAYFVGIDKVTLWIRQSPFEHPVPFLVMAVVTIAVFLHFSWFREQLCIIACPYGRLQSVLLDRQSLIVAYDEHRGEPRMKAAQAKKLAVLGQPTGDCVECGLCQTTCPTGIDIREGLQMECVNCTQCIDACDGMMRKLGRKPGLIRYSSQAADAGESIGWLRPRVIIYPALIATVAALFITVFSAKGTFDAVVLRNPGHPYIVAKDGSAVRNQLRLKLTNRSGNATAYSLEVLSPQGVTLDIPQALDLEPDATGTFPVTVDVDPAAFRNGNAVLKLRVQGSTTTRELEFKLMGPVRLPTTTSEANHG